MAERVRETQEDIKPEEIAAGVFRTEVKSERAGLKPGSVIAEMPDHGYVLWSRNREQPTEHEIREKINKGAKVITVLSGLDAEPSQFEEIVKEIFSNYKGSEELLIMGMAVPGFWRQQYDKKRMMTVGDVSVFKYVKMVLEWSKRLGLNKKNNLVIGHSAGGEAAVWLSKWFKIIALSAALHPGTDLTFGGISLANLAANKVNEKAALLKPAVGWTQEKLTAFFSGSKGGTPLLGTHMERIQDGEGQSHDLKVVELCEDDEIPNFEPNPDDLHIMGGGRDILTSRKKLIGYFEKWFRERGSGNWINNLQQLTGWFPEKVSRLLAHDNVLTDKRACRVVAEKALEILPSLYKEDENEATAIDVEFLTEKIAVRDKVGYEQIAAKLSEIEKMRQEYTLAAHKEIEMNQYLKGEVFENIADFLEKTENLKVEIPSEYDPDRKDIDFRRSNENFRQWIESAEGQSELNKLSANLLGNMAETNGEPVFEAAILEGIRSGEIKLTDERIRGKVARFPYMCEREGWLTNPALQTAEYRGNSSRGYLLDPTLYIFTDLILRRLPNPAFEETDETPGERMAYPLRNRISTSGVWFNLHEWYKQWIQEKRDSWAMG